MKKIVFAIATAMTALTASTAFASGNSYTDVAQVVSASAMTNRVANTQQECTTTQGGQRDRNNAGGVIGGITGALLGSQIGGGNGNKAAIAGGAILGAMTGDRMQNDSPSQSCREVTRYRDMVTGYDVVYRYNGRDYGTTTAEHPGRTIQVRVQVEPQ